MAMNGSFDRVVYETELLKVGAFRCGCDHPAFVDSGPIENYCFVFPRTAVMIEHDHEPPFVANPNIVTFYNRNDAYRRAPIATDGDRSDWFALRHDILIDILRDSFPEIDDRPELAFPFTHAHCDGLAYVFQRQLFDAISRPVNGEALGIEESAIWLLDRAVRAAARQPAVPQASGTTRRHIDLAHAAQEVLSRVFVHDWSLIDIARLLDVSVYHLCHVFRRFSGCTLHEYRHQLRLRWSLEQLLDSPRRTLVGCALDAGFSSHSHYGAAFKRAFGTTPSEFVNANVDDGGRDANAAGKKIAQLLSRLHSTQ